MPHRISGACPSNRSRGQSRHAACLVKVLVNARPGCRDQLQRSPPGASERPISWQLRAIVTTVQAPVVRRPVDSYPVRLVDATPIRRGGTGRKRTGDLDPPILLARNLADFIGHLGQVLILAQDHRNVESVAMSETDDVDR